MYSIVQHSTVLYQNGQACVRFYGPNTKKVCKINVAKSKGYDGIFVEYLSEVVKELLECNLSGKGWDNSLKTENKYLSSPDSIKVKPSETGIQMDNNESKAKVIETKSIYQCPFCNEEIEFNERMINIHMKTHVETNPQCDICAEICKDKFDKRRHEKVCKARSTKFHNNVTVTPGPKRSRPADLLEDDIHCEKCEFETDNSDEFKRS